MKYKAQITNFNFIPLVEGVPSILRVLVHISDLKRDIVIETCGAIKDLSEKFGFTVENTDSWDFTGFIGKHCYIEKSSQGYSFEGFT